MIFAGIRALMCILEIPWEARQQKSGVFIQKISVWTLYLSIHQTVSCLELTKNRRQNKNHFRKEI